MPTWQYLWKSSRFRNRVELPDSDREMNRRSSSKSDSSQGMASGPWLVKPYSSSAWTSRFLKTGWFRYVARTTNLLQLLPTQTATCPAGTSEGMRVADIRALLRQRRSNCRSLTMWRILLHFPSPADISFGWWRRRKRAERLCWSFSCCVLFGERVKIWGDLMKWEGGGFYSDEDQKVGLIFEIITNHCLLFLQQFLRAVICWPFYDLWWTNIQYLWYWFYIVLCVPYYHNSECHKVYRHYKNKNKNCYKVNDVYKIINTLEKYVVCIRVTSSLVGENISLGKSGMYTMPLY